MPKKSNGKSGTGDRDIDVDQEDQVAYWTKRLGIPKWRLKELIQSAGRNPAAVMKQMKQEKVETEMKNKLANEEAKRKFNLKFAHLNRGSTE